MRSTDTPAAVLTASEFHASVLALAPQVAVFDCDGTLWSGDAGSGFMRWTIDRRILSPAAIAALDIRYQGYLAGQVSELDICGEMVQIYAGIPESEIRAAAAEFFAVRIASNIFPEMLALVRELQSRGTEIWAVSSTCDWVIEEGVRRFNIPANRVLAAQVAIAGGIVTDRLIDVPTDEGKVAALARVGITAPDCVFGNSVHDAAMLSIARRHSATGNHGAPGSQHESTGAFPVNPSPALLAHAAAESWPVFYPAAVRPPQPSPTTPSPTKPSPTKPSPTKPSPTKPSPTKPSSS